MNWGGELLCAGQYGQDGGPDRNDGLDGAGSYRPGIVNPQNIQQLVKNTVITTSMCLGCHHYLLQLVLYMDLCTI